MAYVFKAISLRRGAQASATPLLLSIDSSIEAVCHPPSGWLGRGYSVCLHPQNESVLPYLGLTSLNAVDVAQVVHWGACSLSDMFLGMI